MAEMASKPCLLFIRFESSNFKSYRNSIKRGKSVLQNYGGREVAMTQKVHIVEGSEADKYGMGVLCFPTCRQAEMWLSSERFISQQDWLGGVDILCVPLMEEVDCERRYWVINYNSRPNMSNEETALKMKDLITGLGARFVVATKTVMKWRGTWSPPVMIVQQWASTDDLKKLKDNEDIKKLAESMQDSGEKNAMFFEHEDIVSPLASPVLQRRQ